VGEYNLRRKKTKVPKQATAEQQQQQQQLQQQQQQRSQGMMMGQTDLLMGRSGMPPTDMTWRSRPNSAGPTSVKSRHGPGTLEGASTMLMSRQISNASTHGGVAAGATMGGTVSAAAAAGGGVGAAAGPPTSADGPPGPSTAVMDPKKVFQMALDSIWASLDAADIKKGAMWMPPSYEQPMDEIRARLHNHKAGQAFLVDNWDEGSDSSWCVHLT